MSQQVRRRYQAAAEPIPAATQWTMGDTSILEISPEAYFTYDDWCQWDPDAEAPSILFQQQWTAVLSQSLGGQHWSQPQQQLASPGLDSGAIPTMWPPQVYEFPFEQQTLPYLVGDYDTDSWSPAMPPTPQLTPTWHQPQMPRPPITHAAPEAPATDPVAVPVVATFATPAGQGNREARGLQSQPFVDGTAAVPKASRLGGTTTMATPPDESDSEEAESPSEKKTRSEEFDAAADVPTPAPRKKKYLVKNRAAAKRCRDKSRQFELDLAAKEKQVTEQHMYLEASAAALREEVLALKNEILLHGDCDCAMIQGYISKAANQVSNTPACQRGLQQ